MSILNTRKTCKNRISSILKDNRNSNNALIYAGKLLNLWNGKSFMFEREVDMDVLMDFLVFEKNKRGQKLIDSFYDSDVELNDLEE